MRSLVVALVGLAATATALVPNSCTPQSTMTPTSSWTCARVSWSSGQTTYPLTITVPPAVYPEPQLQIVIWNVDQQISPDWTTPDMFQVVIPNSDNTVSPRATVPGTWGNTAANYRSVVQTAPVTSAPNAVTMAQAISFDNACAGKYQIKVDGTGLQAAVGNFGVAVRLVTSQLNTGIFDAVYGDVTQPSATVNMPLTLGNTVSISEARFPGQTVSVPLEVPFAQFKYMIRTLALVITAGSATQVPPTDSNGNSVWTIGISGFSTDTVPQQTKTQTTAVSQAQITITWDYVRATGGANGATLLTVQIPTLSQIYSGFNTPTNYNWGTLGPFFDLSIQLTTVTEFPTLFDYRTGSQTLTGQSIDVRQSITLQQNRQVYQVILDPLWWNTTVFLTDINDPTDAVTASRRSLNVAYLLYTPGVASSFNSPGTGISDLRSFSFYNPIFFNFQGGASAPGSTAQAVANLAPLAPNYPIRAFVFVTRSSCAPFSFTFTATATSKTVANECRSFSDCVTKSNHPSEGRKDDSANEDASRFTHCGVFNTGGPGMLTPMTKCFECMSSADCEEGQYCHLDNGVGADAFGNAYFVDPDSASWTGLCRTKSKSILGKRCRSLPGTVQPFNTVNSQTSTLVTSGSHEKFADNNGFCGDVRTWNATADSSYTFDAYAFSVQNTVRAVLWTGACLNNICMECSPAGYATQGGTVAGRTCVNGRIVDVKDVDFTVRTLTHNSMGGILLAIMCFLITVMTCFGFSMMSDANRHREFFGDGPMTTKDVCRAIFCTSLPCCKPAPVRGRQPSVVATSAQMAAPGHSVTNPLGATAPAY